MTNPGPLYPHYFMARVPTPTRRSNRRTAEMPEKASPHVKLLFAELIRQGLKYDEIEEGTGVIRVTQKSWKWKSFPSLRNLQSVFSFLGWDYVPVPSLLAMPEDISAELVRLALKTKTDVPAVWCAVVAVGVEQALLNMSIAEKRAVIEARHAANDNRRTPGRKRKVVAT